MLHAFVAQSILHALAAAIVIEALLWAWRVADGAWRLRLRLVALAEPLLVLPALLLLPVRSRPRFADSWALFASERWDLLRIGGVGAGELLLVCAAGVGAFLFLRDAGPPLLEALRGAPHAWRPPATVAAPAALTAAVERHAGALGLRPPPVRLLRCRLPVLLCERARQPGIVVSVATMEQLDAESLDAAVAHEVAHAAHRDPLWGYALIAARALGFFNPAIQWTARAIVDDVERRADQLALRLTGRPGPLAHAIQVLALAAPPVSADVADRFERLFWQSRVASVRRRCERLLAPQPPPLAHGKLRVGLAAVGVVGLLYFVV